MKQQTLIHDETIRFSFLDPLHGYIELVLDSSEQKYSFKGWKIMPHKEPFRVRINIICIDI